MSTRRWKFTLLLLSLLVLLVVYPLLSRHREIEFLYELLLVTVFSCSVMVVFENKRSWFLAFLLGVPTVAGLFADRFLPAASPLVASVLFHLLPVFFLTFTAITILKTILTGHTISSDSVNGAFCGYLLIGLTFGHLYCLAEAVYPDSFQLQEHVGPLPPEENRRHILLTYFSFITLTTVGYGDIIPRSPPARSLAMVEAMLGQFYIGVIVAELIALKVSSAIREGRSSSPPGDPSSGPPENRGGRTHE